MASIITRQAHAGRALAVKIALRASTPAGPGKLFANSSYSYPPVIARGITEVATVPTGSKALTGTFIVVGVALFFIIGLLFWRYRRIQARKSALFSKYLWKQQPNELSATAYSEKSSFDAIYGFGIAKPEPVLQHAESASPRSGKWVPQLRANVVIPPTAPRTTKAKQNWEKNLAKFIAPQKNAYGRTKVDSGAVEIPITRVMPPIPEKLPVVVLPPTPMKLASLESPLITPDSRSNLLSPRSSSFDNPINQKLNAAASVVPMSDRLAQEKLPRLMTVTTTFAPTLTDELPISMSETVRLIQEYADEWCLVQRVGKSDDVKGIIPRSCISELKEMAPRLPQMGRRPSV